MLKYEELKQKQVGGSHYKKMNPQPWDFYRGFMSRDMWRGYLLGNIIDYLVRDKNGLEDLKKAQHLLDVLVATEEEEKSEEVGICENCGHIDNHDIVLGGSSFCHAYGCLCNKDTRTGPGGERRVRARRVHSLRQIYNGNTKNPI